MRYRTATLALVMGLIASPLVLAQEGERKIPLKDGSTLVVFKDGKMSMRDKNGKVIGMKEGVAMETKDGQVIMMKGNEIWRKTTTEKDWEQLYRGS